MIKKILNKLGLRGNFSSEKYWKSRYKHGGNSGSGSRDNLAQFKAFIINDFASKYKIDNVIEFGSGDGSQLKLFDFKTYIGYDVSPKAIEISEKMFHDDSTKSFYLLGEYDGKKADLVISLDVIYHLTEDDIFHDHMKKIFEAAKKYVIIYSSNFEKIISKTHHVRHRKFTNWIESNITNFKQLKMIKNKYAYDGDDSASSFADFYIYERINGEDINSGKI